LPDVVDPDVDVVAVVDEVAVVAVEEVVTVVEEDNVVAVVLVVDVELVVAGIPLSCLSCLHACIKKITNTAVIAIWSFFMGNILPNLRKYFHI
jgi:hypothetical protein